MELRFRSAFISFLYRIWSSDTLRLRPRRFYYASTALLPFLLRFVSFWPTFRIVAESPSSGMWRGGGGVTHNIYLFKIWFFYQQLFQTNSQLILNLFQTYSKLIFLFHWNEKKNQQMKILTLVKPKTTWIKSSTVHILTPPPPHSTGRRFRYAHGDLGFSLKLYQIAAEA